MSKEIARESGPVVFRSYHFLSCGSGFILFLPPAPHAFVFHARAPWAACCPHPLHLSQLAGLRFRQHSLRAAGWLLCLTSLLAKLQLDGMWCLDTICWNCLVGESSGARSFSQLRSKLTHQRLDSWTGPRPSLWGRGQQWCFMGQHHVPCELPVSTSLGLDPPRTVATPSIAPQPAEEP